MRNIRQELCLISIFRLSQVGLFRCVDQAQMPMLGGITVRAGGANDSDRARGDRRADYGQRVADWLRRHAIWAVGGVKLLHDPRKHTKGHEV